MVYIIILCIISFLLILYIFGLYMIYKTAFYSPNKWQNDDLNMPNADCYNSNKELLTNMINDLKSRECEIIHVNSFDKIELTGRLYRNESNKVSICFHGYRGTPYRDFSGGGKILIESGSNVLLISERGHYDSKGHSICFGQKERLDAISWCNKMIDLLGEDIEITLHGISMGAATVVGAGCLDNLPKQVKRIVADCPFSSTEEIIKETMRRHKLNTKIFYPFVRASGFLFMGIDINKYNLLEEIKKLKVPLLLIHGTSDSIVPYTMSVELQKLNKDKIQLELFDNAEHGFSFIEDKDRYIKVVDEFINRT